MTKNKEWKPPRFSSYNRWYAKQQLLHHPTLPMIRVYRILDSLRKAYLPKEEILLDGYFYYPIAKIILPDDKYAVIDGRGASSRGFEDTWQRKKANRFTSAMIEAGIPYLYGKNAWDHNYWEINIRRFFMELEQGKCPQWTGTKQPRKSKTQANKRRYNEPDLTEFEE